MIGNPVVGVILLFAATELLGLVARDNYEGKGMTAKCFSVGFLTGFEEGMLATHFVGALGGYEATRIRTAALVALEAVFAYANIKLEKYNLPTHAECGIYE